MRKRLSIFRYAAQLDELYSTYNKREFVSPDPLQFLYAYPDVREREIVGLVAATLAYGRVAQILKSVQTVLDVMGPSPRQFIESSSLTELRRMYRQFKHRFTVGDEIANLFFAVKQIIHEYGTLHACFASFLRHETPTVLDALTGFIHTFLSASEVFPQTLLSLPEKGSACKRLNLYLRWMVRCDDVDPGGWHDVPAEKLIVPMDVHMHRIACALGFTAKKQPSMSAALEATAAFRAIEPDDPVRYDFALTRFGIRGWLTPKTIHTIFDTEPAARNNR